MTENPAAPLRGGIDLAALAAAKDADKRAAERGGGAVIVELTDANAQQVIEESARVPVIVALCAAEAPACAELMPVLEKVAADYSGRFLLATCDVQGQPAIAQAFQVTSVPAVLALIGARPAPLFQGAASEEQLKDVIDQVLALAVQQGITGLAEPVDAPAADQVEAEPEPEPLPPLHQEAYDAIERDDFDAAASAYERALTENPKDADARAGLAQVGLMSRMRDADLNVVRKAAADAPDDIDAQLAVADLDVVGGQVEDAFARLIDVIRVAAGEDRERVRLRLVELFDVVGADDQRVADARRALSAALF